MNNNLSELYSHLIDVFKLYREANIKELIEALREELLSSFKLELYYQQSDDNWRVIFNAISQSLINAYDLFNQGLIGDCYNLIYKILLREYSPSLLGIENKLPKNTQLFRMRYSDTCYLYSKMEMCHIPFNQRNKVSNQRYSLSGFPCLYLGSSLYVCWEELNRPDFANANSALFTNNKGELKLLDLRFPENIESVSSLINFLLAASCSVKSSSASDTFKAEYIIPQAILHSLVKYNNENKTGNRYDGIIYTSSTYWNNDRLWDDINLFADIVIPAIFTSDSEITTIEGLNYSTNIINCFNVKGPTTYNIYDYKQESYTGCDILSTTLLYKDSQLKHRGRDWYLQSKFHKLSSYLIANID